MSTETAKPDPLMPPETLRERMEADGRLWKIAFAEGKRAACRHDRQATSETEIEQEAMRRASEAEDS